MFSYVYNICFDFKGKVFVELGLQTPTVAGEKRTLTAFLKSKQLAAEATSEATRKIHILCRFLPHYPPDEAFHAYEGHHFWGPGSQRTPPLPPPWFLFIIIVFMDLMPRDQ